LSVMPKKGEPMLLSIFLTCSILLTTGVTITEPVDGQTYDGDWLTVRAIVENENELPDSVHYSLNGGSVVTLPRLNTDWPTYMQNYQNHGFSESPSPMTNEILWTAPVTGDIHEFPTPVVVNGIVYYPQDSSGDSLYALDAVTGEIIWKYWTGYTDDAVTVCDGRVYTASDSIWCLDALTGERIWAFGEADDAGGTPIVADNSVFCAADFWVDDSLVVYRLDALSGEVEWSRGITGVTVSCMGLWNNLLIVPTFSNIYDYPPLTALDIETGEVVWENFDSFGGYWDSSPVIVDDVVYITGYDCTPRAFDASSGDLIWETAIPWDFAPTMSYHDNCLYTAYGCLDAANGGILWQDQYAAQHGSSGIAGSVFYYGQTWPDTASIICLNRDDGTEVWNYPTNSGPVGIVSSPSIVDGVMYIAGTDWNLYAFGTGLKYTYLDDLYAQIGSNQLTVTSFDGGMAVASDTVNFTVTQTGIILEPTRLLNLCADPNPMGTNTSVSFTLEEPGRVSLRVFDLSGREVSTIINQELDSGVYSIQWNGNGDNGRPLPSGLFLCRIECQGAVETTGLCLLR
jgi:outer membrane protein assembly factor BamB